MTENYEEVLTKEDITAKISGMRIANEEIDRAESIEKLCEFYAAHHNRMTEESETEEPDSYIIYREEEASKLIGEEIVKSCLYKLGYEFDSDFQNISKRN